MGMTIYNYYHEKLLQFIVGLKDVENVPVEVADVEEVLLHPVLEVAVDCPSAVVNNVHTVTVPGDEVATVPQDTFEVEVHPEQVSSAVVLFQLPTLSEAPNGQDDLLQLASFAPRPKKRVRLKGAVTSAIGLLHKRLKIDKKNPFHCKDTKSKEMAILQIYGD
jgi:hypothetical protein